MLRNLKKLISPSITKNKRDEPSSRYVNIFTLVALLILVILFLIRVFEKSWVFSLSDVLILVFIIIMMVCQFLVRVGFAKESSLILIVTGWVGLTFQAYSADGIRDIALIAYIMIILIAGVLLGWRSAIIAAVFSVVSIWFFALLEDSKKFVPSFEEPFDLARNLTVLYTLITISIYIISNYFRNLLKEARDKQQELSITNLELEGINIELEQRMGENALKFKQQESLIQAIAAVGNAASTISEIDQLLSRVASTLSDHFGFQQVEIFLLDEDQEYCVLRASSGLGGKRLIDREVRLKVEEGNVVGQVAMSRSVQISREINGDTTHENQPNPNNIRLEIALPLISRGAILGVLDIHSIESDVFDEKDIPTLQIIADQISSRIQILLLSEQIQAALDQTRYAYDEVSRKGWQNIFKRVESTGYVSIGSKTIDTSQILDPSYEKILLHGKVEIMPDENTIGIPIQHRGQVIGIVRLQKPEGAGSWDNDEIQEASNLTNQLSLALESARLYEDSRRRAEREATITKMTEQISSRADIEFILRTAVKELGQKLGGAEVIVELGSSHKTEF